MQPDASGEPGLLRNRRFVLLFGAQIVSLFGSGVTTVALALLAAELAGPARAPAVLGVALMLRILAFLLVSQPAGVLADRWPRKPLLLGADICRCALVALLPLARGMGAIYALVFLVNAATAVFTPVYEATLPEVVGRTAYVRAMTLSRVAGDVEAVASPAIAA
ncbi:MAG: MFS transporter, partial [Polyangiaceae bacterium]